MQKTFALVLLFSSTLLSFAQAQGGYTVTSRGADFKVLSKTTVENGTNRVHSYTELATGMNYTNSSGQWVEASETISILPTGGAAATQGRHQVYFPADIYDGVLEVVTPDGRHLKSRPLGVSYDDGSNTVFIAELKNAVGYLTASNQVTYRDAFTGIKADLVCTYRRGGFECDLVFRQQPPTPGDYGLDESFSTLQMVTEFFNTQDPQQIPAASDDWFGLQDSTLKFGQLTMTHGKAFAFKSTGLSPSLLNSQLASTPVYKSWVHVGDRTFLIEEVPVLDLADDLNALPLTSSIQQPASNAKFASFKRQFPRGHGLVTDTNQILLAATGIKKAAGVVLDYDEIDEGTNDMTFAGGHTYLIGGDDFALGGRVVFEGGAVIKINAVGWNAGIYPCVDIYGTAVFPSSPDNPAIFTSMNDDSVGDVIDGSTGSPSYSDSEYSLMTEGDMTVSNLCFSYAICAINASCNIDLWNCEFAHIDMAFQGSGISLHNVLICHGATNSDAGAPSDDAAINSDGVLTAENVTVDDFPYGPLSSPDAYLTNCLITACGGGLGNVWGELATNNVVCLPTSTGDIYQTAENAGYYLATSSPYRNIGTTNINPALLAALQTMTTYAPQDGGWPDTNGTDLGYHYPVNEDSDHDGLPDWWEWKYYGIFGLNATNLDVNGDTLLYDYANNIPPNSMGRPLLLLSTISIADPVDIKWVSGDLYVLSGSTATITEFDAAGNIIRSKSNLGVPDSPPPPPIGNVHTSHAVIANSTLVSGFDVDSDGNLYVAVTFSNQVWKYAPTDTSFAQSYFDSSTCIGDDDGSCGTNNGELDSPFEVAVSLNGQTIAVSDSGNNRIQTFDSDGNFLNAFGETGNGLGQFNAPTGLTYDSVGSLYVTDSGNNRIVLAQDAAVLDESGTNGTAVGQFNAPAKVSVGERGIYIADAGNNRIQCFNPLANGDYSFDLSDFRFALSTNLNQPLAVAVVDNLTNEMFYVADTGNNRVLLYGFAADDPTPAWTNMTAHVAAGDVTDAISQFASVSTNEYEEAFTTLGTNNIISVMNQIATLTPVYINNDQAEYYFTNTISGQMITFPVEFVKENGIWKILEF